VVIARGATKVGWENGFRLCGQETCVEQDRDTPFRIVVIVVVVDAAASGTAPFCGLS